MMDPRKKRANKSKKIPKNPMPELDAIKEDEEESKLESFR